MSAPLPSPLDGMLAGAVSGLPGLPGLPAPSTASPSLSPPSPSPPSPSRAYLIHTPTGADFVDFGAVTINSPTIRLIRVENLLPTPLTLDLSPSQPEDVELYMRAGDAPPSPGRRAKYAGESVELERFRTVASGERKERFIEALADAGRELEREASGGRARDDKAVMLALRRGGKGRATQVYARAVVYKDRALLDDLEWLDLCAGAPVCAKRTAKSKLPAQLETIERERARGSGHHRPDKRRRRDKSVAPAPRVASPPPSLAQLSIEDLVAVMDASDAARPAAADSGAENEEQHVRHLRALRKEWHARLAAGALVRAQMVHVAPRATQLVLVVLTPNSSTRPHITTRAKRADSRLFVRVADGNADADNDADAPTDLILRSMCARSVLEVQQSSVNFGTCARGETKSRTIVLHNRSDCVGIYRMRLSGSIASSDLALGLGRYGVIPAYGRRQVETFSFTPRLVGAFSETIVVENVLDALNDQRVHVKAAVVRPPAFAVDVERVDLRPGAPAALVLTNMSRAERAYVLEVVGEPESVAQVRLARDDGDAGRALSRGEEEEVETLLQKLKIARRKGKADKVDKYVKRLGELGVQAGDGEGVGKGEAVAGEGGQSSGQSGQPDGQQAQPDGEAGVPDGESHGASGSAPSATSTAAPGGQDGGARSPGDAPAPAATPATRLVVTLAPSQKTKIIASLVPGAPDPRPLSAAIRVHDEKDTDETLAVPVTAAASPATSPVPPAAAADPVDAALMRRCLELTLRCPVSPTAFCVGALLFLPATDALYPRLSTAFPVFTVGGVPAGLVLAEGYSREIPGNTHAEANALANFRAAYPAGAGAAAAAAAASALPAPADVLAAAVCYATMEPCSVRTSGGPSCARELATARVSAVALGVMEPADFVVCDGVRILQDAGVAVRRVDGLESECLKAARRGRD